MDSYFNTLFGKETLFITFSDPNAIIVYLSLIGLILFGLFYARYITLNPFPPGLVVASIIIGCFVTNLGMSIWLEHSRHMTQIKETWFTWSNFYFLFGGAIVWAIGGIREKIALPERLDQQWAYVVIGCILPLLATTIHVYFYASHVIAIVIPLICYCVTGGPMILAQEIKFQLESDGWKLTSKLIEDHRQLRKIA